LGAAGGAAALADVTGAEEDAEVAGAAAGAGGKSRGGGIVGAATGEAVGGCAAAAFSRSTGADKRLRIPETTSNSVAPIAIVSAIPTTTATSGRARAADRGVTVLEAAPSVGTTGFSCVGSRASRSDAPPSSISFPLGGAELMRNVEATRGTGAPGPTGTTGIGSVEPSPRGEGNTGPEALCVSALRSTGPGARSVSGSMVVELPPGGGRRMSINVGPSDDGPVVAACGEDGPLASGVLARVAACSVGARGATAPAPAAATTGVGSREIFLVTGVSLPAPAVDGAPTDAGLRTHTTPRW